MSQGWTSEKERGPGLPPGPPEKAVGTYVRIRTYCEKGALRPRRACAWLMMNLKVHRSVMPHPSLHSRHGNYTLE